MERRRDAQHDWFGWWALNFTADLAYPTTVTFNATGGPDWDIAVFTAPCAGYFMSDPSQFGSKAACNFQLQAVAGVEGEVSLNLYFPNGTQIGTFSGAVIGVSLSKLGGSGSLSYND